MCLRHDQDDEWSSVARRGVLKIPRKHTDVNKTLGFCLGKKNLAVVDSTYQVVKSTRRLIYNSQEELKYSYSIMTFLNLGHMPSKQR